MGFYTTLDPDFAAKQEAAQLAAQQAAKEKAAADAAAMAEFLKTYQYNPAALGITQQDTDPGMYNLMLNGQSLGTGYDSLDNTLRDLGIKAADPYIKWVDPYYSAPSYDPESGQATSDIISLAQYNALNKYLKPSYTLNNGGYQFTDPTQSSGIGIFSALSQPYHTWNDIDWGGGAGGWSQNGGRGYTGNAVADAVAGKTFATKDELISALDKAGYFSVDPYHNFYGQTSAASDLQKMEQIAQMLKGDKVIADQTSWRDFGNDKVSDKFNPLYGSTPVIQNGKLIGYMADVTQPTLRTTDNNGSTVSDSYLQYQIPDTWKGKVFDVGNGQAFIPLQYANSLDPATLADSYNYHHEESDGGFLGGLGGLFAIAAIAMGMPELATLGTAEAGGAAVLGDLAADYAGLTMGGTLGGTIGGTVGGGAALGGIGSSLGDLASDYWSLTDGGALGGNIGGTVGGGSALGGVSSWDNLAPVADANMSWVKPGTIQNLNGTNYFGTPLTGTPVEIGAGVADDWYAKLVNGLSNSSTASNIGKAIMSLSNSPTPTSAADYGTGGSSGAVSGGDNKQENLMANTMLQTTIPQDQTVSPTQQRVQIGMTDLSPANNIFAAAGSTWNPAMAKALRG